MIRRSFFSAAVAAIGVLAIPGLAAPVKRTRLKAWMLNEYEAYSGETLEEAIAACMAETGNTRDEVLDEELGFGYEMPRDLVLRYEDDPETTVGEVLDGMTRPGLVAAWE